MVERIMLKVVGGLLAGAMLALVPVGAVAGEARIRVQQSLVSATFDAVPATAALDAIRRATGVELMVPPSLHGRTVTLGVQRLPLEAFFQRVAQALNVGGFALVYEPGGKPGRLIVVDRRGASSPLPARARAGTAPVPADVAVEDVAEEAEGVPDTDEAEPVDMPEDAEGAVYIPLAEEPVYIPSAEAPVYIPPAAQPARIPPGR